MSKGILGSIRNHVVPTPTPENREIGKYESSFNEWDASRRPSVFYEVDKASLISYKSLQYLLAMPLSGRGPPRGGSRAARDDISGETINSEAAR